MKGAAFQGRLDYGEGIGLAASYTAVAVSEYTLGDKTDSPYPLQLVGYLRHRLLGRGFGMDMAHYLRPWVAERIVDYAVWDSLTRKTLGLKGISGHSFGRKYQARQW